MSVQVRRRREAASFLQTYVGAQGELLVDTTDNRVQVHDGVTPGGWPAARIADLPGRNAVINGTFAVNQRAYASGAALAASAYAHDRWKAGAGGCTYTFIQTVPDTTITITAGTLLQAVDAPNVYASAYWLSWTGTASARVWQGTAAGAYAASPILVTGLAIGTVANLEFGAGTLGLVQLEGALPNASPTRFERLPYATVLDLCRHYYQSLLVAGASNWVISSYQTTGGTAYVSTPVRRMRATPTSSFVGTWTTSNVSTFGLYAISPDFFGAYLTSAASGYMQAYNPAGGGVALSAEL